MLIINFLFLKLIFDMFRRFNRQTDVKEQSFEHSLLITGEASKPKKGSLGQLYILTLSLNLKNQ